MADIRTFTNEADFWAVIETLASWPETLAMSGGSAANFLDQIFVPDTAEIFLADERCVPSSHSDSNAKLIRSKLKEKNFVDRLNFYQEGKTPAECTEAYAKILPAEGFDLVVLGVGPDGHTASLFPSSEALNAKALTVATTAPAAFAVKDRLSLTFAALEKSKKVLVLLQGASKAEIFAKITNPETDPQQYPGRTLLDWENTHIFWLNS